MEQHNASAGKILRVKAGYNPNSSSVGSQIPAFLFFAAGTGVFAIITAQIFNMIRVHIRKKKDSIQAEKQK